MSRKITWYKFLLIMKIGWFESGPSHSLFVVWEGFKTSYKSFVNLLFLSKVLRQHPGFGDRRRTFDSFYSDYT